MITKQYGKDFVGRFSALTLSVEEVSDEIEPQGYCVKQQHTGWSIGANVQHGGDYYWVNEFVAVHEGNGWVVFGDFEKTVTATSEEAFKHFWANHYPEEWDYSDI